MSDSDAWNDIQAIKSKQSSLRAKMLQRRKEREGIAAEITKSSISPTTSSEDTKSQSETASPVKAIPSISSSPVKSIQAVEPTKIDPVLEKKIMLALCDIDLDIPCSSSVIAEHSSKILKQTVKLDIVEELLKKFAGQQLINITVKDDNSEDEQGKITVNTMDISKLSAMTKESDDKVSKKRKHDVDSNTEEPTVKQSKVKDDSIESLLSMESAKEKENKKLNEEILELLDKPTAKEQFLTQRFKSQGGAQLKEFCQFGTREECSRLKETSKPCKRLHFRKIINKHTDESLGDCSFLNTCFHMDTCKYVHYEVEYQAKLGLTKELSVTKKIENTDVQMFPPQWIQCDLRVFDMSVLGKCAVIMADPPWDIHMELPYGTMQDDEMRKLPVPALQDDGYIFLWVTGRAMELGRECLDLWGYTRMDELIWVKTNQLQRIIRTGRTGHWLNHGKEHCLVGVKGNPKGVNCGLDCDVIVAEVRATSHKPDEVYGIIERLSPGTRKVELFGRPHNVQPNWITLGNQTEGVRLKDPDIVARFKERYPDGNCMEPAKPRS